MPVTFILAQVQPVRVLSLETPATKPPPSRYKTIIAAVRQPPFWMLIRLICAWELIPMPQRLILVLEMAPIVLLTCYKQLQELVTVSLFRPARAVRVQTMAETSIYKPEQRAGLELLVPLLCRRTAPIQQLLFRYKTVAATLS